MGSAVREAQAVLLERLLPLELTGWRYKELSRAHGLNRADVHAAVNVLVETGRAQVDASGPAVLVRKELSALD